MNCEESVNDNVIIVVKQQMKELQLGRSKKGKAQGAVSR